MRFRFSLLLASFALALLGAHAQAYPNRPITIVVPLPPGTSTDVSARILGKALEKRLGQPFVIENAKGANGIIGTLKVKAAAPDGYRLLMALGGTMALLPAVDPKLPFDPIRDFTPVAYVSDVPYLLVSRADTLRTIADLRARAERKATLNYGAGANPPRLWGALLGTAGLPMTLVGYIGDPKVLSALLSGEIQAAALTETVVKTSDALAVLATFDEIRNPDFPGVPTLAEAGFPAEFARMDAGIFLMAPAKTPGAIQATLARAVHGALEDPAVIADLTRIGMRPRYLGPAGLAAYLSEKLRFWQRLVADPRYGSAIKQVYGAQ